MYERGHYRQLLEKLDELITRLDEENCFGRTEAVEVQNTGSQSISTEQRDSLEYHFYKFKYMKAKVLRKTRKLQSADELCQSLIDLVKERMPGPEAPFPSAPAVASAVFQGQEPLVEEVNVNAPKAVSEPKAFWKFAVKAAYLKVAMLAGCMEFSKPKRLMFEFAEPVLVAILKKFVPEIFTAEENRDDGIPASLSEKVLPDHYYSFQHRRVYAKLRR